MANWTYTTNFTIPSALLGCRVIQLTSMGIDTVASIQINDKIIWKTDNMFQRIRLNIKNTLVAGQNTMKVSQGSPDPR